MTCDEAKRALHAGHKIRLQGQKGFHYLEEGVVYYKSPELPHSFIWDFNDKDKRALDWEIVK